LGGFLGKMTDCLSFCIDEYSWRALQSPKIM
jgi:hypothetical protein